MQWRPRFTVHTEEKPERFSDAEFLIGSIRGHVGHAQLTTTRIMWPTY